MTLQRQALAQKTGYLAVLLAGYITSSVVGLVSAVLAPNFRWGFLLIGAAGVAGWALVVKTDRRNRATLPANTYGQTPSVLDRRWLLFAPLAAVVGTAGLGLVLLVNDFLFA